MATSGATTNGADDGQVTGQQWYWTALSAMASYIDAGSIVAIAAGLALWADYLSLSTTTIGLLAAFGPNAMGAALGAVIGGRLGDKLGRKRIYQYDLLLYAFGTLWMVFAFNTPMLIIGTFLVGLAVGADVPTSLALVGELAPSKARAVRPARHQDSLCPPVRRCHGDVVPQAGLNGVGYVDRRCGGLGRVGRAVRGGAWPARGRSLAQPVQRIHPKGYGVYRRRVHLLEPGCGDIRLLPALLPEHDRGEYSGWERRLAMSVVCHHARLRGAGFHAVWRRSAAAAHMGYRVGLPNNRFRHLRLLPLERPDRLQCRGVFCQHHSIWHRSRHRRGATLQNVVPGGVSDYAQDHGSGRHVRDCADLPWHLELLRTHDRSGWIRGRCSDPRYLPHHQRCGRLPVHAQHGRQVTGRTRGRKLRTAPGRRGVGV